MGLLALALGWVVSATAAGGAPSVEPLEAATGGEAVVVRVRRAESHLRWGVSAGELSVGETAEGVKTFVYAPPLAAAPQIALLAFWNEDGDAPPDFALVRIAIRGKTELSIETEPLARVSVDVLGTGFGPFRADAQGHLRAPLEIPPGVEQVLVHATAQGRTQSRPLRLNIPRSPPLALLGPSPLRGSSPGWLWVVSASRPFETAFTVELVGASYDLVPQTRASDRVLYRIRADAGASEVRGTLRVPGAHTPTLTVRALVQRRVEVPVVHVPSPVPGSPYRFEIAAGGFTAGGANRGFTAHGGVSYTFPGRAHRLSLEGELGFRRADLSPTGPVSEGAVASLTAAPIDFAARWGLFESKTFRVALRVGAGALVFDHHFSAPASADFHQGGARENVWVALQASYRVPWIEPFVELRAEYAPIDTGQVRAQLGGIVATAGARFGP